MIEHDGDPERRGVDQPPPRPLRLPRAPPGAQHERGEERAQPGQGRRLDGVEEEHRGAGARVLRDGAEHEQELRWGQRPRAGAGVAAAGRGLALSGGPGQASTSGVSMSDVGPAASRRRRRGATRASQYQRIAASREREFDDREAIWVPVALELRDAGADEEIAAAVLLHHSVDTCERRGPTARGR